MKIQPYFRLLWRLLVTVKNWPVYFLNRCKLLNGEIRYKLWNGTTVLSRPFVIDGSALNDVWLDESYDPNHFGIPFEWSKCRTIVDVGANIGTFTLYAAAKAPDARIISIEPEPGNAEMVRKNIAENALEDRVNLIEAGVAKAKGMTTFYKSFKNSGGHSLFHHKQSGDAITVPLTTLQDIFDDAKIAHCDFLKLDCEGGEYHGLYGLRSGTLSSIRFMAVEYHTFAKGPHHTPEELKAFLEDHGFTIKEVKTSIFFAWKA